MVEYKISIYSSWISDKRGGVMQYDLELDVEVTEYLNKNVLLADVKSVDYFLRSRYDNTSVHDYELYKKHTGKKI